MHAPASLHAELDPMESTDVGDGALATYSSAFEAVETIGPYRVEATIGAGAMGVVYAAFRPGTPQRIAVKLMHRRGYYAAEDDAVGRRADAWLHNEARALSRLSHPNVVRIYGVGTHRGRPYLAMELVQGRTLASWLAAGGHAWDKTLRVCIEAARGLAAAHRAGVLHGDFKPDNIMVAADGRVLVMDFGLSRTMTREARASTETAIAAIPDDHDQDGVGSEVSDPFQSLPTDEPKPADSARGRLRGRPGTPAYMAPELLAGVGGDARSDQFSLCVAMYKALFGCRPYGGRTASQIAFRVTRNDLRVCPANSEVPVWVHAAVVRGLTLDPDHRWRDVDAMIHALEHGLARRQRRRNVRVSLCVGAVVTLAGLSLAALS